MRELETMRSALADIVLGAMLVRYERTVRALSAGDDAYQSDDDPADPESGNNDNNNDDDDDDENVDDARLDKMAQSAKFSDLFDAPGRSRLSVDVCLSFSTTKMMMRVVVSVACSVTFVSKCGTCGDKSPTAKHRARHVALHFYCQGKSVTRSPSHTHRFYRRARRSRDTPTD